MQEAGRLIEIVQAPIGTAVEDFGSHKLVLPDLSIREELLLLLYMRHTRIVSPLLTCLRPLREGPPAASSEFSDRCGRRSCWMGTRRPATA